MQNTVIYHGTMYHCTKFHHISSVSLTFSITVTRFIYCVKNKKNGSISIDTLPTVHNIYSWLYIYLTFNIYLVSRAIQECFRKITIQIFIIFESVLKDLQKKLETNIKHFLASLC